MIACQRQVMQFKVTLLGIQPRIWRRIVVPETYSFWDLHVAIQDAMGWLDYDRHMFEVTDPSAGTYVTIGIPDPEGQDTIPVLPGWDLRIADFFLHERDRATYAYDFSEGWVHAVVLEKRFPAVARRRYPRCTGGARCCPPEGCGGIGGYQELLEAVRVPEIGDNEWLLECVGGCFDPEEFNNQQVEFDDPRKRFELMAR